MAERRVAIVGAGIIGISAALHLLEKYPRGVDLTVISESFSPNTTSDKAGCIILNLPNTLKGDGDSAEIQRWTTATFQKFHSIYSSAENVKVGVNLIQGYIFFDSHSPDPWYKDIVFGFRHVELESVEAKLLHIPPNTVDIWSFSTYTVETTSYLQWMENTLKEAGVKFELKKIHSLDELVSYDVIVNCTGLGSRELLDDELIRPMRGQVVVVRAPWVKQWLFDLREGHFTYIIPRATDVVLGGTAETDNWSETPSPSSSMEILGKCQKFFPSLSGAEVIGEWAGLRPLRDPLRLESCVTSSGNAVIHCYGHGGQGVLFSWGCAVDIGNMISQRPLYKSNM